MKKIGVIMEVNPFHNGHKYFLEQVKDKIGNDYLICVISTTFTQRGEISILSKEVKTNLLLDNNVDLVIELPIVGVNQGGEYFGYYAVKALNAMGVDKIIFGSESNDKEILLSSLNLNTTKNFSTGYIDLKLKSNDILGISYLKAIKKINKNIDFDLIKRKDNEYNSIDINTQIVSATAIRYNFLEGKDLSLFLPRYSLDNMCLYDQKKFIELLYYKLDVIKNSSDIFLSENGELINKIKKVLRKKDFETIDILAVECSDKNNSKYKFQRLFLNIIFDITNKEKSMLDKNFKYKVLGFSKRYSSFLKGNKNIFLSYKDKSDIYEVNQRVDRVLSRYSKAIDNSFNYQKPIIK